MCSDCRGNTYIWTVIQINVGGCESGAKINYDNIGSVGFISIEKDISDEEDEQIHSLLEFVNEFTLTFFTSNKC